MICDKGLLASAGFLSPVLLTNYSVAAKKKAAGVFLLLCISLYFCMEGYMTVLLIVAAAAAGTGLEDRGSAVS